jgi:hypothetical protein
MWYDEKPQSNFPCMQEELGNAITYATNNQQAEQQSLDPIEMLALMNSKRSLGVHYPAMAIYLMKTIKTVILNVCNNAIHALVFVMRSLDKRCVNYVELVVPPFLDLIKSSNDNLVIDLINQLGSLVGFIKKHIDF